MYRENFLRVERALLPMMSTILAGSETNWNWTYMVLSASWIPENDANLKVLHCLNSEFAIDEPEILDYRVYHVPNMVYSEVVVEPLTTNC